MTPENVLMWSAAIILACVAAAAVVFLGAVIHAAVIQRIVDEVHRRRANGLTNAQVRDIRAYANRLRAENYAAKRETDQ